jgi:hypothetical protein
MPTSWSSAAAESRASRAGTSKCAWITSVICAPTVKTGLRLVIGSWKIIAIRRPRTRRSASPSSESRSVSPKRTALPVSMRPGGGTRRSRARLVRLLPQPDSPTSASVSPRSSVKLTPSTALTRVPSAPGKVIRR